MTENTLSPSRPAPLADPGGERDAYARSLCHHHAAPLLVVASVLLDDVDEASDVVAVTIAAACRDGMRVPPDAQATRTHLARSVYRRSLGLLAARERFPQSTRPNSAVADRRGSPFAHLTAHQRAIMALVLFGGHDVTDIALTLGISRSAVIEQLPDVLQHVDVSAAP